MNPKEFQKYAVKHMGISSSTLHQYGNYVGDQVTNLTPYIIEERQSNISQLDVLVFSMLSNSIHNSDVCSVQLRTALSALHAARSTLDSALHDVRSTNLLYNSRCLQTLLSFYWPPD